MQEKHIVKVVTKQTARGETSVIKSTSLASFCGTDGNYTISYTDAGESFAGSVTELHVENGSKVTVNRNGGFGAYMVIEAGRRNVSQNSTPYGYMSFGVSALKIDSKIKNGEGTLRFGYVLDVEMDVVNEIEFDITLRKRKV